MTDRAQLDFMTAEFFSSFVSKDVGNVRLEKILSLFIPQAIIIKTCGGPPVVYSLKDFIEPRQKILTDGSLLNFQEKEISAHTEIFGDIAQRRSVYEKSGCLNGKNFHEKGVKTIQFVRSKEGWKISSLSWDDEREGFVISSTATAFEIPEVESQRLRLRSHRPGDFVHSASMWAEPTVVKYITGTPSTTPQAWSRFLNYSGHWQFMHFGYWVIEEKNPSHFIGEMGFADFKRELTLPPEYKGLPELGWALIPAAQGKGYATEAIQAALTWGKQNLKSKKTICMIAPENKASLRVAEKTGFKELLKTIY